VAEHDYPVQDGAGSDSTARAEAAMTEAGKRRGPDGLALVVGLLTIGMAVAAFTGHLPLLHFDPRWLLAGAAGVVGVLLLLGSLRRR
jgi:hypothetical protein